VRLQDGREAAEVECVGGEVHGDGERAAGGGAEVEVGVGEKGLCS